MKILGQKRKLLEIIATRDEVTSSEFYSMYMGRFAARLHELKKLGINYYFKNRTYYFPKWSQEKARELLDNEFQEGLQEVDNEELNSLQLNLAL